LEIGAEIRIQTADERNIHPANRVSFRDIAAPIRPRLEKSATWMPERVMSLLVEMRKTYPAVTSPVILPMRPRMNCFFIVERCMQAKINLTFLKNRQFRSFFMRGAFIVLAF